MSVCLSVCLSHTRCTTETESLQREAIYSHGTVEQPLCLLSLLRSPVHTPVKRMTTFPFILMNQDCYAFDLSLLLSEEGGNVSGTAPQMSRQPHSSLSTPPPTSHPWLVT